MSFFLGIDGGGSKTACLIGDETSVLGAGTGAGSNAVRVGKSQARQSLDAAIRQACAAARIAPTQIERTCVGIAGGARLEIATAVREFMSGLVSGEIEIVGDMEIAFASAFGERPGVIVVAGTGSIAYGRNSAGRSARAGGWGFAISDEGSGHWIGRSAVAAAMRAHDEATGERTNPLLESIRKTWSVETLEQLVVKANASPAPDFAALLPAVVDAATAGDAAARAVLTHAGGELAALAGIVIRRLFAGSEEVPVAAAGGVLCNCEMVRREFYDRLRAGHPQVIAKEAVVDPVKGALELARKGRSN